MMLAAADPDDTGPIVINGAPMSYWGGAWAEGENDNPMRYAGGLLGGTWLSSLASDLGDGVFDGAYLVENFENLNPANTFWDKYYHLYANVDTEPPRFLEFERWWGGFYLMNREEIEWITHNLFVGNKLWKGEARMTGGKAFDLRNIKAPIILFASMGDNITPPQQAFNWVADVYGSTDEIKARGQVIVGLMHETVGHLGIFVSGKVAKKEHAQIVEVLKSIESLPPGLYGMKIAERKRADGEPQYEVSFDERRLEDVTQQLNRFERADEKPFEAVAAVSDFNQRAYELFAQPLVQAMAESGDGQGAAPVPSAALAALGVLRPESVPRLAGPGGGDGQGESPAGWRGQRRRAREKAASATISASLDYYRAMRDAASEAGVLPDLRQRVLAVHGRQAGGEGQRAGGGAARAAVRPGGARARSRTAATPRRWRGSPACWRARASRCCCRSSSSSASSRPTTPICCPTSRRTSGAACAASRTSSCATSPSWRSRRCRSCCPNRGDRERLGTLVQRLLADERVQRAPADCRAAPDRGRDRRHAGARSAARCAQGDCREDCRPQARRQGAGQGGIANAPQRGWRAALSAGASMEREHAKYQRLLDFCKSLPPTPTAVAHPCDESSLQGAVDAARLGLIAPILVGPKARIEAVAQRARHRHRRLADRRRRVQPGLGRQGGRARARGQGRGADEGQPAHRRADGARWCGAKPGCARRGASATAS